VVVLWHPALSVVVISVCKTDDMGHQLVWMRWQSIQIVGASACVIFILHQKILKMVKCIFWYQLTRVVPDKVQKMVVCVCVWRHFFRVPFIF